MTRDGAAIFIALVGTGINMLAGVQQGKPVFYTLLGGIAFGTLCVGINTATKDNVGNGLAVLFLFSSVMRNGPKLLETMTTAIDKMA